MGSLKDTAKKDAAAKIAERLSPDVLIPYLRKQQRTTKQIMEFTGATERKALEAIGNIQDRGFNLTLFGDSWEITKKPPQSSDVLKYKSEKDHTYTFGFSSDQHLCSKYERLDVLNDLYDKFADRGITHVFNGGNWIDGEARFNKHDLKVAGLGNQLTHLVDHYPQRDGIVTYAVAGDDHEGWYGQNAGTDIGKQAASEMKDAGRSDWVNLGYMEAFIELVDAESNRSTHMLVMHPGGGSAYAHSYKPQKIVESFQGGEKPSFLLIGHYHKLSFNVIRNVFAVQSGTTQDQTPFMRKKGIDAHVGGGIAKLTQDPYTGALVACQVEFFQYFNEGYYNNRWSHGGPVTLAPRGVK